MQKNDIIELKIEDMGVDGEGIGKYDGMTFFVKDAVLGDEIEARITKMKKNYGYARVEQILSPSKFRVTPQCELHRRCGGCQIQALDYEKQLEFKQNKVRGNLIRIGGFAPELIDRIMLPVVGMKEPYRYRNKAQFPIGADKDGNPVAGFYAARTHSIIPVNDCKLGVEENQIILNEVLSYMKECHVASYDENTGKGLVRHVLIRYGFSTKELMVCVIINGNSLPKVEKLIDRLTAIEGMKSISINQNTKKTNVILGDVTKCIWGDPYITDMIHLRDTKDFSLTDTAVAYHISPQSFYQVNPVQTEKLYSLALDYAGLTGKERVIDAYCGTGTIGLIAASKAKEVIGVELNRDAVKDAVINAKRNNIKNEQFYNADAGKFMVELAEQNEKVDVVFMDPPRAGSDEAFLSSVVKLAPKKVVYVSCNPETLARDLKYLTRHGYQAVECQPCDMFPFTKHVETVCLLSRKAQ